MPRNINIADRLIVRRLCRGGGRVPALTCETKTLTYAELFVEVGRAATTLRKLGIEARDRVVFQAPNSTDHVAAILGCIALGAVATPVSTLFREEELKTVFLRSEPALAIVDDGVRGFVAAAAAQIPRPPAVISTAEFADLARTITPRWVCADTDADDGAYTIYTSGSSGSPKGVEHGHRSLIAAGDPVLHDQLANTAGLRIGVPTEVSSLIALDYGVLWPLYAGGHGYLMSGRFDADRFARYVAAESINVIVGVPTMFRRMLQDPDVEKRHDLSCVTAALCGGEPLELELHEAIEARFKFRLHEMIGSSEAHPYIANAIDKKPRRGSMGMALQGRDCSIRGEDGSECRPGETGHLCIAATDPALGLGYVQRGAEWRKSFRHGHFYTGDLARRDDDGYFWFESRADDLILSRGYRVSPTEIERSALKHAAVSQVVAVGVKDAQIGQRIKLYVVLKSPHVASAELESSILATTADGLAPYKAPKELAFVADLPTTSSGKLSRTRVASR